MTPTNPLAEYFRCPDALTRLQTCGELSEHQGYFTFQDAICYGRLSTGLPSDDAEATLVDVFDSAVMAGDHLRLPFDLSEVVTNLRQEQYHRNGYRFLDRVTSGSTAQRVYYFLRPMMRVPVRKHLQKIRLSGWDRLAFPRWPVDVSVDTLLRQVLGLVLKQGGVDRVPFVWFWPDGADCALMMTHDVEGPAGRAFCDRLMDLDDEYDIKSAFQLIPQGHEQVWRTVAEKLRRRGFEVNLHDLNHDGYLFHNHPQFLERAREINRYAREFQCHGFRSGAMYREQGWYEAFEFSYDLSVPNVAHLEPQRGGCCTVMPYFVGKILELPLTTIQDYSLFHILDDYSITLWRQQIETIRQQNGLMTFLSHPDYLADPRALGVYEALLAYLQQIRARSQVWAALPGEINHWWRNRQQMRLVRDGGDWRIEGPENNRARIAYATLEGDRVVYRLPTAV